jgi:hypothetical protein
LEETTHARAAAEKNTKNAAAKAHNNPAPAQKMIPHAKRPLRNILSANRHHLTPFQETPTQTNHPPGMVERKIVWADAQIWAVPWGGKFVHLGPRAIFLGRTIWQPTYALRLLRNYFSKKQVNIVSLCLALAYNAVS